MTNRPTDPRPGDWLESQLRRDVIEQGRRQRASWARWDAKLAESQARIDDLLARERAAARGQAAAEVVATEPDEAPAPIEGHVPPPTPAEDLDLLAAQSLTGSELHQRWRNQHVNRNRGIFTDVARGGL
jgi:hypothetical protein